VPTPQRSIEESGRVRQFAPLTVPFDNLDDPIAKLDGADSCDSESRRLLLGDIEVVGAAAATDVDRWWAA
jgi:hypothetical protein